MTVIYEINYTVDAGIVKEHGAWLREHIARLLAIDGFTGAEHFTHRACGEGEEQVRLTVQYRLRNCAALRSYLQHHAPAMQREVQERFGGDFTVHRRIMELVERITPPEGETR